jgi:hypothetical protein
MRSRRARRESGDKTVGIALAVAGIVLIAALGGGAWWLRKIKEPLDADNCPRSGPTAVHLIMIDRSDPITGQQAQAVRQRVEKLKTDAAFGTRFDIYTFVGDSKNEMRPFVRVCAPGRPEQANELIENPVFVRRRYDERFANVLDHSVAELLQVSTLPNSPIIESLRAAAITSFGPLTAGTIPLHVTLVSDMVQNTALASQFKTEPNFAQLAKTSAWTALQPNLKGADVEILYLIRPGAKRGAAAIQSRGHQLFWEQLIAASDGRLTGFLPI